MKKIVCTIILLGSLFFINVDSINAADMNSTMMTICEYDISRGADNYKIQLNYKSDTGFNVFYSKKNDDSNVSQLNRLEWNRVTINGSVMSALNNKQICPTNVYLDFDFLNEICFANGGKECENNTGTNWEKDITTVVSAKNHLSELIEEVNADVDKFSNQYQNPNASDCMNFNNSFADVDLLSNSILTIARAKYGTYGLQELPDYFIGFDGYGTVLKKFEKSVENISTKCTSVIENAEQSGEITKKEADEWTSRNDEITSYYSNLLNKQNDIKVDVNIQDGEISCDIFGSLTDEFNRLFNTVKYLLIGALIALTILDFIKAMAGDKDELLKKAFGKFVKRVGIIVAIFILPLIIDLIIGFFLGDAFSCLGNFM